eukprot:scaffold14.g1074.t1
MAAAADTGGLRGPGRIEKRHPRHTTVADTSDEEAALPEDPIDLDEEVIMPQRVQSRELFREITHLPKARGVLRAHPEAAGTDCGGERCAGAGTARGSAAPQAHARPDYPSSEEEDSIDKHRSVADLASDADEMLPDDPIDMDEELIQDTKPFISAAAAAAAGGRRLRSRPRRGPRPRMATPASAVDATSGEAPSGDKPPSASGSGGGGTSEGRMRSAAEAAAGPQAAEGNPKASL